MPQTTSLRASGSWLSRLGPGRTARALCVMVSAVLLLCGVILALAAPAAQSLAGRYLAVIQAAGGRCPGDPVPAPQGCWSLAHATVAGSGVAADGPELHLTGTAGTRILVRLATPDDVAALPKPGSAVGLHMWGQDVTAVEVAAASPGAAPRYLLTQANPFYRLGAAPSGGGSVVMLGLLGLALAMAPRAFAAVRVMVMPGNPPAPALGPAAPALRLHPMVAAALAGPALLAPPNPDGSIPGGPGWNIRPAIAGRRLAEGLEA
ncbi:MAG TPA: hypothetical protein VGQ42_07620 [Candidatus Dormibacteraeota bacterium]|jgi:hypothetical protein|nr:hypothetical protein [Candidatus Dormibacteraeota bacterium]